MITRFNLLLIFLAFNAFSINASVDDIQSHMPDHTDPLLIKQSLAKLSLNQSLTAQYYQNNNYKPTWINEHFNIRKLNDFLAILNESQAHGLSPDIFNVSQILQIVDSVKNDLYLDKSLLQNSIANLEIYLTDAAIRYTTSLRYGYLNPKQLFGGDYNISTEQPDSIFYKKVFSDIANDPVKLLISVQPRDPVYLKLQEALIEYSKLQLLSFDKISAKSDGTSYQIGSEGKDIVNIMKRLDITGEYDFEKYSPVNKNSLSKELLKSVNLFRVRNSYWEENSVGKVTINALNRPFSYYYKKIIANLERYRWRRLNTASSDKKIEVNIAASILVGTELGRSPLVMNVCVGRTKTKTPLLQSKISYLNLNPTWTVPTSISQKEICLAMKKDSTYLQRQNMRMFKAGEEVDPNSINWKSMNCSSFTYLIRQDPGDGNSLGRIKFMFNNKFSVYLHDTPSKGAFRINNRAVSHGCVRVENPMELAYFCTNSNDPIYKDRIRFTIDQQPISKEGKDLLGKEKLDKLPDILNLKTLIPLSIDYATAYILPGREDLYFADDIYNYDDVILSKLSK